MFSKHNHAKNELLLFYFSSILAVIALASICPMDKYFLPNFAYLGFAPALAYCALLCIRPAIAGGAVLGFAIVILAFAYWTRHDGMGWLVYLFSLPGGFIACVILAFKARTLPYMKAFVVALLAIPSAVYVNFIVFYYGMP